jgi:hypothetical protein
MVFTHPNYTIERVINGVPHRKLKVNSGMHPTTTPSKFRIDFAFYRFGKFAI